MTTGDSRLATKSILVQRFAPKYSDVQRESGGGRRTRRPKWLCHLALVR
jgi:hypothetical protein